MESSTLITLGLPYGDAVDVHELLSSYRDTCDGDRQIEQPMLDEPMVPETEPVVSETYGAIVVLSNDKGDVCHTPMSNFPENRDDNEDSSSSMENFSSEDDEEMQEVKKYFSSKEWKNTNPYQRKIYRNLHDNYNMMCKAGLPNPPVPEFMRKDKCQQASTSKKGNGELSQLDLSQPPVRRTSRLIRSNPCNEKQVSTESSYSRVQCSSKEPQISHSSDARNVQSGRRKRRRKSTDSTEEESSYSNLPFFNCESLDETGKSLIIGALKNSALPKYNIDAIVNFPINTNSSDEEDSADEDLWKLTLKRKGQVFGNQLQSLVKTLMDYLYESASHPNAVTMNMREGMAVSLVAQYPLLCQPRLRPTDNPWSWLLTRQGNMGKFANVVANKQKALSPKKRQRGGGDKKKLKAKRQKRAQAANAPLPSRESVIVNPPEYTETVDYLKVLNAVESFKGDIIEAMQKTFVHRRKVLKHNPILTSEILEEFPHFLSFEGELIEREFHSLYPSVSKDAFLRGFQHLIPKLLKTKNENPDHFKGLPTFMDDTLNALFILGKFLPKPKRTYKHEKGMITVPTASELIHIVPAGVGISEAVKQRRTECGYPTQPYLLAKGHPKALGKMYLVLGDSEALQLARNITPARAIDILFKTFFCFETHFFLGWKNVFRFIQVHLYGIPPENPRHSTFVEEFLKLKSI